MPTSKTIMITAYLLTVLFCPSGKKRARIHLERRKYKIFSFTTNDRTNAGADGTMEYVPFLRYFPLRWSGLDPISYCT